MRLISELIMFFLIVGNTGLSATWESEPWGSQISNYKDSMSLLENNGGTLEFTYRNIPEERTPSDEELMKIWTFSPYVTNGTSTVMPDLTEKELASYPGLKQWAPPYIDGKKYNPTQEDDRFVEISEEELKVVDEDNSYHKMKSNAPMIDSQKVGKGPKFFNYGVYSCINAIVTRFDEHGNVQMTAMQRPKNADSDAGEYQMSAGCLFFGGKGHQLDSRCSEI